MADVSFQNEVDFWTIRVRVTKTESFGGKMANRKTRVSTLQAGFRFCYEKRTRTKMLRKTPTAKRRQMQPVAQSHGEKDLKERES
jgi:hypothetical protein